MLIQEALSQLIGLSLCIFTTVTMKEEMTCISLYVVPFLLLEFFKALFQNSLHNFKGNIFLKKSTGRIQDLVSVAKNVWKRVGYYLWFIKDKQVLTVLAASVRIRRDSKWNRKQMWEIRRFKWGHTFLKECTCPFPRSFLTGSSSLGMTNSITEFWSFFLLPKSISPRSVTEYQNLITEKFSLCYSRLYAKYGAVKWWGLSCINHLLNATLLTQSIF